PAFVDTCEDRRTSTVPSATLCLVSIRGSCLVEQLLASASSSTARHQVQVVVDHPTLTVSLAKLCHQQGLLSISAPLRLSATFISASCLVSLLDLPSTRNDLSSIPP
ncbi:hypothetical protein TSMEX_009396, partial [Taenia solium]